MVLTLNGAHKIRPPIEVRAGQKKSASGGDRTLDLLITNQPLCRLSYAGSAIFLPIDNGFTPPCQDS
jgi:hypothetical protein